VCVATGLPLAWRVETAKAQESSFAIPLLEAVIGCRFRPKVAVMDMGYDHTRVRGQVLMSFAVRAHR